MFNDKLLALPVLIPILAGIVFALLNFKREAGKNYYTAIVTVLNLLLVLFIVVKGQGSNLTLFSITKNLPIMLKIDQLSVFYTGLLAIIWTGVTFYSFAYIKPGRDSKRFYSFLLPLFGAMTGIGFSGNIITFYLFYEMMTFLAFPLICHSMTKEDIKAAITYLIYSIFGATLVLIGIAYLSGMLSSTGFVLGGILDPELAQQARPVLLIVTFLMIIGFGCKAGMFPLHAWLPVAHPAAPAPFSALLSALITKAGVLGIIRVVYYIVGVQQLQGTWVQTAWMSFALITVFMGSMLALREPLLKKRLAFSSNSQISYILFGLSVMTANGYTAALLQLYFHAFAKTILFLCAGSLIELTGHHRVEDFRGCGQKLPVIMVCFTVASLSLIGIPPLGGFVSKWHLITSAMQGSTGIFFWLGPAVLMISALLTAGYLLPIIIDGFLPAKGVECNLHCETPSPLMTVPLAALTALSVGFALFSQRIFSLFEIMMSSMR